MLVRGDSLHFASTSHVFDSLKTVRGNVQQEMVYNKLCRDIFVCCNFHALSVAFKENCCSLFEVVLMYVCIFQCSAQQLNITFWKT